MRILAAVASAVFLGPLPLPCSARADCVDYASCIRWVASVDTPGCTRSVAISGNYAFVGECSGVVPPGNPAGLTVVDIADPLHPRLVTRVDTPGDVIGVVLSGTRVYVTESPLSLKPWRGLQVIDVADPAHPRIVGSLDSNSPSGGMQQATLEGLAVVGRYAYVAASGWTMGELRVIDVLNPRFPRPVCRLALPGAAHRVAVSDGFAYVTSDYQGLRVIDIGDPRRPQLVATVEIPGNSWDVAVSGTYAYVADMTTEGGSLQVVDITKPREARLVGAVQTDGQALSVTIWGNHAILSVSHPPQGGVDFVDITDPRNPRLECCVGVPDASNAKGIAVAGTYAFVANYDSGLAVLDIRWVRAAPIIGHVTTPRLALGVAVSGTTACVADWYLDVIDVADPGNPRLVGHLDMAPNSASCVAVAGSYAYVGVNPVGGHGHPGLTVVDIENPSNPRITGSLDLSPPLGVNGVVISGTHAYVVCFQGLEVVDIGDPSHPRQVGGLSFEALTGVAVSGSYAYCTSMDLPYRLDVVDVSVPESPSLVGSVIMPGIPCAVAVEGSHACVPVIGMPGFGLEVVDIVSPQNPRIVGSLSTGVDMVLFRFDVSGGYAYLNCSGVGLLVFDVRNPELPSILGNLNLPEEPIGVTVANGLVYVAGGSYIGGGNSGLEIVLPQCELAGRSGVTAGLGVAPTALLYVFPNPATRRATLRVMLPVDGRVAATIYDVSGRQVRSLRDGVFTAGVHHLAWDGRDDAGREVAPGVYLARVLTPEGTKMARMVIMR